VKEIALRKPGTTWQQLAEAFQSRFRAPQPALPKQAASGP